MSFYNYRKKRKRRIHSTSSFTYRQRRKRPAAHRKKRKHSGVSVVLIVLSVFLILAAGACAGFFALRESGRNALFRYAGEEAMQMDGTQEETGLVSRNGKKYQYKEDIITLLCMGIDKDSEAWKNAVEVSGENGQADAIFLLVLDSSAHRMKLVGISRDTMTQIRTFDRQGNEVGKSVNHLALAFSYGKTPQEGAELVKDAVRELFYQLPIHGYVAIDWSAVGKINDSVGGVTVTLPEDAVLNGSAYYKGDTVHLNGEQAMSFIRYRGEELGSNNERMLRQRMYASAFIVEAKNAIRKNPLLAADLYTDLTSDMTTSISINEAVYLASLLPEIPFNMEDIVMTEGTVKQGKVYEEFYVDEEKLMDLILETFYEEVG